MQGAVAIKASVWPVQWTAMHEKTSKSNSVRKSSKKRPPRRVQRKIDQENGIVVADDDLDDLDLEDGESAEEIADRAAGLVRQTESA